MNSSLGILRFVSVGCLFAAIVFAAVASAQEAYCPATVSVKQEAVPAPAGWRVTHDPAPHSLMAVTFYEGPVEQNASLVPNNRRKINPQKEVESWHFVPNPEGNWISCQYASTDIALVKQLPGGTTSCTVTYNRQVSISGHSEIDKVSCTK